MSRMVIALSGWKGSGKDTAADVLVQEGFVKLSFASKLKDMVARDYGIERAVLDDPSRKEMPLHQYPAIPGDPFGQALHDRLASELKTGFWTPRALCILEGSAKRAVHSNYWVRSVASEIMCDTASRNFVISDLRYKTEADTLKLLLPDVKLIRIERYDSIETSDPSERDLDDYKFDYILRNRGTMDEFHLEVSNLLRSLTGSSLHLV